MIFTIPNSHSELALPNKKSKTGSVASEAGTTETVCKLTDERLNSSIKLWPAFESCQRNELKSGQIAVQPSRRAAGSSAQHCSCCQVLQEPSTRRAAASRVEMKTSGKSKVPGRLTSVTSGFNQELFTAETLTNS